MKLTDSAVRKESSWLFSGLIERWIYVFTTGLFVVTVLVGFIPVSSSKVAAVLAGTRPPFPII